MASDVTMSGAMSDTTKSLTDSFGDVASGIVSSIGDVLPYILIVVGVFLLIGVAFKIFKYVKKG